MVCRPEVSRDELHPEEGQVPMITSLAWKDLLNERGQVEDDLTLRKGIFFGGLEPALRKIVWPFLLHCYSYQSTLDDREQIDAIRRQEYEEIQKRRITMNPEQAEHFWRNVVCIVEKDVVRTDRGNPYYAGEDNPNIEVMKYVGAKDDGKIFNIIFLLSVMLIPSFLQKYSTELCSLQFAIGIYTRYVRFAGSITGRAEFRDRGFLVFRWFNAKICGCVHAHRCGHGQKPLLLEGIS